MDRVQRQQVDGLRCSGFLKGFLINSSKFWHEGNINLININFVVLLLDCMELMPCLTFSILWVRKDANSLHILSYSNSRSNFAGESINLSTVSSNHRITESRFVIINLMFLFSFSLSALSLLIGYCKGATTKTLRPLDLNWLRRLNLQTLLLCNLMHGFYY